MCQVFRKTSKKFLTKREMYDIIQALKERSKKLIENLMNIWLIKIQKIQKKFLTMSSKYGIIHTVRNEASNKVSEILEKGFLKREVIQKRT